MNGSAFEIQHNLIIPFGNIQHFLLPHQIVPVQGSQPDSSKMSKNSQVHEILVNFVLDPCSSYFSPFNHIFKESEVEYGLENMFKLESLGLDIKNDVSTDNSIIENFQKTIEFKDNCYHIELPWKKDLVEKIPSNHKIALSVLNRVQDSLKLKNLTEP